MKKILSLRRAGFIFALVAAVGLTVGLKHGIGSGQKDSASADVNSADNSKGTKTMKIFNSRTWQIEEVEPVVRTDAEWKKLLTAEQYEVARGKGTERPFSKVCAIPPAGSGVYQCIGCGTDLFAYGKKFESGTGWPSFWDPVSPLNVKVETDRAHGMVRDEVLCARCGSHLGHVFPDGPPPSGKRYCINTVALKLDPDATK